MLLKNAGTVANPKMAAKNGRSNIGILIVIQPTGV
jgi:hypothetical protein